MQLTSDAWELLVSGCRVPPGAPCLGRSVARSKNGQDAGAGTLLPVSNTAVILSWGREPLPSPERWGQASPDSKGIGRASRFLRGPVRERGSDAGDLAAPLPCWVTSRKWSPLLGLSRDGEGMGQGSPYGPALSPKEQLLLSWAGSRCGLSFWGTGMWAAECTALCWALPLRRSVPGKWEDGKEANI